MHDKNDHNYKMGDVLPNRKPYRISKGASYHEGDEFDPTDSEKKALAKRPEGRSTRTNRARGSSIYKGSMKYSIWGGMMYGELGACVIFCSPFRSRFSPL